MRTERELVAAANQSYLGAYRTIVKHSTAGEIREIGGVFAFTTGFSHSLFNGCIVVEPASPAELESALDWLATIGLPHRLWIAAEHAEGLGHLPLARGFQRDPVPYPGMVLHPPLVSPAPSVGVTVVPVGEADFEEYHQVSAARGASAEVLLRQVFSPSFAADPDVKLFIGRLDGRAVGTSVAIRSGDVSGVYAVGTLPAARRRGVGTALTWAAVAAGRGWGCDVVVLQASEMGLPLYTAMGFRTVVNYATFTLPSSP